VGRIAFVDAAVKWPNDLLVRPEAPAGGPPAGYGKCAGVLAEATGEDPSGVVVGIGLNVSQRAGELPPAPDSSPFPPTSLALVDAICVDRHALLRGMLRALAGWYDRWRAAGGDAEACGLRDAYRRHCLTIGSDVAVALPGGELVRGRASDVDADGRLVVQTPAGPRALAAGDVGHAR
jgi:BirA family biotin operon repressor/biotin-[acetyl-CoA-carboxylase] ligase